MSQLDLIVLSENPKVCAEAYTDEDLAQRLPMYLDTLELAHWAMNGGKRRSRHVLARWAEDPAAWWWLHTLCQQLLAEQHFRFGCSDDDCHARLFYMAEDSSYNEPPPRFLRLVPRVEDLGVVGAYRKWYHEEATPSWTRRGAPKWWEGSVQLTLQF